MKSNFLENRYISDHWWQIFYGFSYLSSHSWSCVWNITTSMRPTSMLPRLLLNTGSRCTSEWGKSSPSTTVILSNYFLPPPPPSVMFHEIIHELGWNNLNWLLITRPGECFTMTKIDFKLDLTMTGCSCHCVLSPFTGIDLSRDLQIMVINRQNVLFMPPLRSSRRHYVFGLSVRPSVRLYVRLYVRPVLVIALSEEPIDGFLPNFGHVCILQSRWTD